MGDDWRSRWALPIAGVLGGVLAIPMSFGRGGVNLPILLFGMAAVLLGGIGLVDRTAAFFVKDEAVRARLRGHARMANNGFLGLVALAVVVYEVADIARHLQAPVPREGAATRVETQMGSRGTHYVYIGLSGQDGVFKWGCKWDCAAFDALRALGERQVRLQTLDREILGVEAGGQTLVDAGNSRNGDIGEDLVFGVFGGLGVWGVGRQILRDARAARAATAAGGAVQ